MKRRHPNRRELLLTAAAAALVPGASEARSPLRSLSRVSGSAGVAVCIPTPTNTADTVLGQSPFFSAPNAIAVNISPTQNFTSGGVGGVPALVDGVVTLTCGSPGPPAGSCTIQWMIGNPHTQTYEPLGPQITSAPPGTYSWDTTTVLDGTYQIGLKILDATSSVTAYTYLCTPRTVIVLNGSPSGIAPDVAQTVAVTPLGGSSVFNVVPDLPDFIPYPGDPSLVTNTTWPTNWGQPVPPATSDTRYSGDPTVLRSIGLWYMEPGNEYGWQQYMFTPAFLTVQTGGVSGKGVYVGHFDPQAGGLALDTAYDFIIRRNPYDGGRLDSLFTPWSEFQEYPDGSGWLGIEIQGSLRKYGKDGSVTTIFGFQADRTQLSVDYSDLTWPEGSITRTHIGTCTGFDDLGGAGDLCFDSDDSDIVYVAVTLHNFIAAVNINTLSATIYAGIPSDTGMGGYNDSSNPALATFQYPSGMTIVPTSGHHDPKGTIYIADRDNNAIRRIARVSPGLAGAVDTVVSGTVRGSLPSYSTYHASFSTYCPTSVTPYTDAYIMGPNKVAITSTGGMMVVETWNNTIRFIDFDGNRVIISGTYGGDPASDTGAGGPGGFRWVDCDYTGACGPVDDWLTLNVTAGNGHDTWRGAADGSYEGLWLAAPMQPLREGNPPNISNGLGHYSWGVTFARTQGRIIGNGIGTPQNRVMRIAIQAGVNGATVSDPSTANPPVNYGGTGYECYMSGTACKPVDFGFAIGFFWLFPFNSRPTFYNIYGAGSTNLGSFAQASYDDINSHFPSDGNYDLHPGDPANAGTLTAFIQAGMNSTVPRPEFTGNTLRDLIYWMRRSSHAGSYPTVVAIGPTNPDTTAPVITNVCITHDAVANTLTATWDTDKPTYGFVMACSDAQFAQPAGYRYNLWAIESFTPGVASYKTTGHTATITNLPAGVTPLHVTVQAKDIPENTSFIADQVIS